ncbi:DUF4157 domain-containing protein [Natronolimnobius sp. AArcel1]|uniref:eCIS core domain-containing protein n=1 Tax=Natronolimnobius sp. AArcel1 TaxID=1679093 RepID=UPI0013EBBE2A
MSRKRQTERALTAPWGVDHQHTASVQRSREAQHDTAPAGDADAPDSVRELISSPGRALDGDIQEAMEDRMGDSFGDVRIHTGPKAAQACEQIDARAFTVGNHIAFNAGEYDPASPDGQFLLAHELTHVRQQTGASVSMMPQQDAALLEIDPDPQLEREADEAAAAALQGDEPLVVNRMGSEMHIQRSTKGNSEYVTKDEVLEIVDNYYRGQVDRQAELDATQAGPDRQASQGTLESSSQEGGDGGFLGKMKQAWENTKSVGSDLSQAMTKGAVGSLAGAGGKLLGQAGGGSLGALIGGATGSLAGPVGTGAGVAVGYKAGETLGGEIVGGAASDVTKQVTEYTLPKEHAESVADLHQKYDALKEELDELKKASSSTGVSNRPETVPTASEADI